MSNRKVGLSKVIPSDQSQTHLKQEVNDEREKVNNKQESSEKGSNPFSTDIKNRDDLFGLLEAKNANVKEEDKVVLHSHRLEQQKSSSSGFAQISAFTTQLFIVQTFVNKIKVFSSYYRFTLTRRHLFDLINDVAFDFDYYYFRNVFQNKKPSKFRKTMNSIQTKVIDRVINLDPKSGAVMLPNSMMSRIWDSIQLVFLLIYIIYLPIRLAFDLSQVEFSIFFIFEVIPNILQIINLFLEFNTGFFLHGVVIVDRAQILQNYLKKKFMYDFLLNICWLISLSDEASIWFKTVGMLRIIVVLKLLGEVEQTFSLREMFGSYFSLVKLGGFIFLCAHLCGCCWYALAIYEKGLGVESTWLDRDAMNFGAAEDLTEKGQSYIASIYWCIVTMTTIGYGDIIPSTFRERIFSIIMCVIASFIFAFSMSSIGDIIRSFSLKQEEFKQNMAILNVYMKKRKLNLQLQTRVRKYYENMKMEEQDDNEKGAEMIHSLNSDIKEDVLKEIFTNIFKNVKFLKDKFSESFISKLYTFAEEKHIPVDEFLFKEGDKADKLYLILKGEVQLTLQNSLNMQRLHSNDLVGITEFITNQKYTYSARCSRFCQFVEIKLEDFTKAIKETSSDYERFCELRDSLLLNQESKQHNLRCEGCSNSTHLFVNCPYINLSKQNKSRFVDINKRKQITRSPWERKRVSYQALRSQFEIALQASDLMDQINYEKQMNMSQIGGSPSSFMNRKEDEINEIQNSLEDIEEISRKIPNSVSVLGIQPNNTIQPKSILEYHGVGSHLHIQEESHGEESPKLLQVEPEQEEVQPIQKPSRLAPLPPILLKTPISFNNEDENFSMKISTKLNKNNDFLGITPISPYPKTEPHNPKRRESVGQRHESFKRKSVLPHLSQRTNKFDLQSKLNGEGQQNQASDQKKQIMKGKGSRMATVVNIQTDDFEDELTKLALSSELIFDKMYQFEKYMTHNNYEILLNKYNQIISRNHLYHELIEKAKQRELLKKKSENNRRRTLFKNTIKPIPIHKRIPSSQNFYQESAQRRKWMTKQYKDIGFIEGNEIENTD